MAGLSATSSVCGSLPNESESASSMNNLAAQIPQKLIADDLPDVFGSVERLQSMIMDAAGEFRSNHLGDDAALMVPGGNSKT